MLRYDSNGLIYPTIPGVLYVKWVYFEDGDPKYYGRRYTGRLKGDPETVEKWKSLYIIDSWYEVDRMLEGLDVTPDEVEESGVTVYVYPNGTKVYEYPDGGIDPYEFLGLSRQ